MSWVSSFVLAGNVVDAESSENAAPNGAAVAMKNATPAPAPQAVKPSPPNPYANRASSSSAAPMAAV